MGYLDYAGLQYLWGKLKEKFAPKSHSHDDRYYTETEMDGKLNSKVNNNEEGANGLINKLSTADGIPNDATVFISQHNDGKTASYYRRPISTLWTYIKSKTDSVYQPKGNYAASGHTHDDRYYTEAEVNSKLEAKASSDHTHGLNSSSLTKSVDNTTTNSWDMVGGNKDFLLRSLRMQAKAPDWLEDNYAAGIAFGGANTKGVISHAYNAPDIKFAGGNGAAPVWWLRLTGTSGKTYNLNAMPPASHTHTKDQVGLGNVDNTSDASKSVKYAANAGNANTATKATTATKLSSNAGSNNQPVYFSGGKPVAIGYTIAKSVPADAKFTDTNTWRGIQNNLTSDSTDQSLSAAQGKALKTLVDGKAPISHTHKKSQITDFPSSMPASDVYAWAKAATKPSYTKAEVGLGNVDNTADKDKSVKYATSAGSATTGLNGVSTCIFDLSSNNGSCVRFYNGLQICFGNSSKSNGVVFKLPFANDNYAVVVGGSDTLKNAWYVAGGRTTTGFNPNQSGFAVLFHWIAIGNWK